MLIGKTLGASPLEDQDKNVHFHRCSLTWNCICKIVLEVLISTDYVCSVSHFSCVRLFVTSMDRSLPGFSVHGVFQARILEWVAISSSSVTT